MSVCISIDRIQFYSNDLNNLTLCEERNKGKWFLASVKIINGQFGGHEKIHFEQPTNFFRTDNSLLLSNQAKGKFDLFLVVWWFFLLLLLLLWEWEGLPKISRAYELWLWLRYMRQGEDKECDEQKCAKVWRAAASCWKLEFPIDHLDYYR